MEDEPFSLSPRKDPWPDIDWEPAELNKEGTMEQPETKLEYIIENQRLRETNAQLLEALEAALGMPMESPAAFRQWKDQADAAIKAAKS